MKILKTSNFKNFKKANKVTTRRHSLLNSICDVVEQNNLTELDYDTLEAIVSFSNFQNYFKNDVSQIDDIDTLIEYVDNPNNELDVVSKKMTAKEAKIAWLKRAVPYIKSHVIGNEDSASLNNNKARYQYNATEKAGIITFSLNVIPAPLKAVVSKVK